MARGTSYTHAHAPARRMRRPSRVRQAVAALVAAIAVMAGLIAGVPSPATAAPSVPPMTNNPSVPVVPVTSHYQKPKPEPQWKPAVTSWPSGTADVTLSSPTQSQAAPGIPSPAPQPADKPVQAGKLPVWVAPRTPANPPTSSSGKNAPTGPDTPANGATGEAPAKVHVSVAPRSTAQAVGITGAIVGVQRADGMTGTGSAQLSIGYGSFRDAFGGGWANRLHLVTLPACALTTPKNPACRTATAVPFTRDGNTDRLSTTVVLPGASRVNTPAPTVLLAATSSSSSSEGDYSATTLKPEGSWQAGGSTDSFTWSYPITVPKVPGGLEPKVGLSYNSQAVDGLTSSTNEQASWIGDGWDYSPGFIERSFGPCSDNPAGPTKTGDKCWSSNDTPDNVVERAELKLIMDDSAQPNADRSLTYHPLGDSDDQVLDEPTSPVANGAQNGEYFVVTTDDGTKYYFGRNQLPGYQAGTSDAATNSVWTEPVYFTSPVNGQNCYNTTFATSWCQEAYRWNLDYVVDTHHDVISYFYNTESNYYAAGTSTTATTTPTATTNYIRGGYLATIQYGQHDGHVYDTQPAAQVVFKSAGRCETGPCDPSTISSSTASNWPDIPTDLTCAYQAACQVTSPSFWTDYALQSIETDALVGTSETPVDSWTLTHSFPDTNDDTTTPALWLSSIQHSGLDTTAGGSSSRIDLPARRFHRSQPA